MSAGRQGRMGIFLALLLIWYTVVDARHSAPSPEGPAFGDKHALPLPTRIPLPPARPDVASLPLWQSRRILAIGDSMTQGVVAQHWRPPTEAPPAGILAALSRTNATVVAVPGQPAWRIHAELRGALGPSSDLVKGSNNHRIFDLAIITAGTNDALHASERTGQILQDVDLMLREACTRSARAIVNLVFPVHYMAPIIPSDSWHCIAPGAAEIVPRKRGWINDALTSWFRVAVQHKPPAPPSPTSSSSSTTTSTVATTTANGVNGSTGQQPLPPIEPYVVDAADKLPDAASQACYDTAVLLDMENGVMFTAADKDVAGQLVPRTLPSSAKLGRTTDRFAAENAEWFSDCAHFSELGYHWLAGFFADSIVAAVSGSQWWK